jgi:hypothetical protein
MSRSNLCFQLCFLEREVQVTTYDFRFMDNSIKINLIARYKQRPVRKVSNKKLRLKIFAAKPSNSLFPSPGVNYNLF